MGSPYETPPQAPYPYPYQYAPQAGGYSVQDPRQAILDEEHLRLLRIGFFISAGQTAFFIPFGLFYAAMGLLVTRLPSTASSPPPPAFMPLFFGIFGLAFAGIATVLAILKLLTAMRLRQRRSRVLCLVTAGFALLELPYGTALGIMTFSVLGRPSVRELFERGSAAR